MIRSAQTAARGTIISMKVAIMTAIRICIRYCRNAVSAPTWICAGVDPLRAEPEHRDAGDVEHQHHHREDQRHAAGRSAARWRSGRRWRRPNRSRLVRLADERADHPDAGDLLAQHPVDGVDPGLHEPEAAAPSGG